MSTYVVFEGDGLETNFVFPFPYLSPTHVKVYVNGLMKIQKLDYELRDIMLQEQAELFGVN